MRAVRLSRESPWPDFLAATHHDSLSAFKPDFRARASSTNVSHGR